MKPRRVPGQEGPAAEPDAFLKGLQFSPYRTFTREDWARLRADTPMTLDDAEVERLDAEEVPADDGDRFEVRH